MLSEYYPWLLASLIVYLAVKSIYRLYFHPLSKFPGPKLTAITHLYEFYHDIIRNGMFIWEIEKMHEKYGIPHLHPYMHIILILQAQLSESIHEKYTSTIPPTTMRYTPPAVASERKIPSSSLLSWQTRPWSPPSVMVITAFDGLF